MYDDRPGRVVASSEYVGPVGPRWEPEPMLRMKKQTKNGKTATTYICGICGNPIYYFSKGGRNWCKCCGRNYQERKCAVDVTMRTAGSM